LGQYSIAKVVLSLKYHDPKKRPGHVFLIETPYGNLSEWLTVLEELNGEKFGSINGK
jgi:hypothetical protein